MTIAEVNFSGMIDFLVLKESKEVIEILLKTRKDPNKPLPIGVPRCRLGYFYVEPYFEIPVEEMVLHERKGR